MGPSPTVFVPVTRPWACDRFFEAIEASDVPKDRIFLLIDAPKCRERWVARAREVFAVVEYHETGNAKPSLDMWGRGATRRHLAMRRLSQTLVPDGLVLFLEDDTIVPPVTYAALRDRMVQTRAAAVSGYQTSRHGTLRAAGVWGIRDEADGRTCETLSPEFSGHADGWRRATLATAEELYPGPGGGHGTYGRVSHEYVDAVGHYCLLTAGWIYREAAIAPGKVHPWDCVDFAHTSAMQRFGPLVVDWSVGCGHLLKRGVIGPDPIHRIRYRDGREVGRVEKVVSPTGHVFFKDFYPGRNTSAGMTPGARVIDSTQKEAPMERHYRTKERVLIPSTDGTNTKVVKYGRNRLIPYEEAVALAKAGFINDPELCKDARVYRKDEGSEKTLDEMNLAEIRAFAAAQGISLEGAGRKTDDVRAFVKAAIDAKVKEAAAQGISLEGEGLGAAKWAVAERIVLKDAEGNAATPGTGDASE